MDDGFANLWAAFEATAAARAGVPALLFADRAVPFAELRRWAERCAGWLGTRGIRPGDVVALQLPKRLESYSLLLACLSLGAPYVFVDPKSPPDRTRRLIDRVRPKLLFSSIGTTNPHGACVDLADAERGAAWLAATPTEGASGPAITGADPAYIMFTSGSTGEPKGAVIPHQGVLSLMRWARHSVWRREFERFSNINPLHFDNSVFDIYCGLFNGASLVPVETAELTSPVSWVKALRAAKAEVVFAVPTFFLVLDQLGLLTAESLPSATTFLFGGEGFPIANLREFHRRFGDRARLINVYGPTETSCICTSIEITADVLDHTDTSFPPLGRMHENFSYRVLNEDRRPVRPGEAGELWIGGPCVGLGYFGNPEQTTARFCQDPCQDAFRALYYRSGDLVREDRDGCLWFHGRADNQVKIRGYRIELEEIDLAVQSVSGVRRALTVVIPAAGGSELHVAFAADRPVAPEEVQTACRERLPDYMRPARILQLHELPRNANGKADRRAVKSLLEQQSAAKE